MKDLKNIKIKNYYELNSIDGFITNAFMYDLKNCLIASGFPMRAKLDYTEMENKLLNRGKRLGSYPIGSGENNFLKGVYVNLDITLPVKVWTEWERYVFSPIISSQSSMHKMLDFSRENFTEYTNDKILDVWLELREEYKKNPTTEKYIELLESCPTGLKLTARVSFNLMSARNMVNQRRNHRLPEWRIFCKWCIDEIPYFKELTGITE